MKSENDNLIIDGIKTLLDVSPLYGNIVMNLVREVNPQAANPLALKWQGHHWYLLVNPNLLTARFTSHNQVAAALAHEALHVIWQHPTRYAQEREHNQMVDIGTDLAVNQYLPRDLGELPGAISFQTINELYHINLPHNQDSSTYISLLSEVDQKNSRAKKKALPKHTEWQSASNSIEEAESALKNVIKKANDDTKYAGRGNVSGAVLQQISEVVVPKRNWKSILRSGISQAPNKKKDSRARFNRRQAYRLDLPGEISRYDTEIAVFIDNSASISNSQASEFLANAMQITKQFDINVHFFSFDTKVHQIKNIKTWQRHAGGGTTFQSIFDALPALKFFPLQTLVVIFTDGDGEKELIQTKFKHVYWLLPEGQTLSIPSPFGKVITL